MAAHRHRIGEGQPSSMDVDASAGADRAQSRAMYQSHGFAGHHIGNKGFLALGISEESANLAFDTCFFFFSFEGGLFTLPCAMPNIYRAGNQSNSDGCAWGFFLKKLRGKALFFICIYRERGPLNCATPRLHKRP